MGHPSKIQVFQQRTKVLLNFKTQSNTRYPSIFGKIRLK